VSKSGRDIGGSSLWGSLFDVVLEKYHWTFDYLLWGISFVNVHMLLSDSIYHSIGDGQTKSDNEIINADDPCNSGKLNELIKNS
jgi:hypothetical protein